MEDGNKSLIIWLRCLPSQTLSTPRGIAHTNSVQNVKHTDLDQQTLQTLPHLNSQFFFHSMSPKAGKLIFLTFVFSLKMNIVFAGRTILID